MKVVTSLIFMAIVAIGMTAGDAVAEEPWWEPYSGGDTNTLLLVHFDGATGQVYTDDPQLDGTQGETGTVLGTAYIEGAGAGFGQGVKIATISDQVYYWDSYHDYSLETGTVEFWFKPINWTLTPYEQHFLFMHEERGWNQSQEYISSYVDSNGALLIYLNIFDSLDPGWYLNRHYVAADITDMFVEDPDQWHHVAATWHMGENDGESSMELYIDGSKAYVSYRYRDTFAMPMSTYSLSGKLRLGNTHQMSIQGSCLIDEFRTSDVIREYKAVPKPVTPDSVDVALGVSWSGDTEHIYNTYWADSLQEPVLWQLISTQFGINGGMSWADEGGNGRDPATSATVAQRFYKVVPASLALTVFDSFDRAAGPDLGVTETGGYPWVVNPVETSTEIHHYSGVEPTLRIGNALLPDDAVWTDYANVGGYTVQDVDISVEHHAVYMDAKAYSAIHYRGDTEHFGLADTETSGYAVLTGHWFDFQTDDIILAYGTQWDTDITVLATASIDDYSHPYGTTTRVVAIGNRHQVFFNGKKVIDFVDSDQSRVRSGYTGLGAVVSNGSYLNDFSVTEIVEDTAGTDCSIAPCVVVKWQGEVIVSRLYVTIPDYQVFYRAAGSSDPWQPASAVMPAIVGEMAWSDFGDPGVGRNAPSLNGALEYEYMVYKMNY
jgi:Concanavalin A-like lectin/glucanases superfamily